MINAPCVFDKYSNSWGWWHKKHWIRISSISFLWFIIRWAMFMLFSHFCYYLLIKWIDMTVLMICTSSLVSDHKFPDFKPYVEHESLCLIRSWRWTWCRVWMQLSPWHTSGTSSTNWGQLRHLQLVWRPPNYSCKQKEVFIWDWTVLMTFDFKFRETSSHEEPGC